MMATVTISALVKKFFPMFSFLQWGMFWFEMFLLANTLWDGETEGGKDGQTNGRTDGIHSNDIFETLSGCQTIGNGKRKRGLSLWEKIT